MMMIYYHTDIYVTCRNESCDETPSQTMHINTNNIWICFPAQGLPGKDGPPGRQGPSGTIVSDY